MGMFTTVTVPELDEAIQFYTGFDVCNGYKAGDTVPPREVPDNVYVGTIKANDVVYLIAVKDSVVVEITEATFRNYEDVLYGIDDWLHEDAYKLAAKYGIQYEE